MGGAAGEQASAPPSPPAGSNGGGAEYARDLRTREARLREAEGDLAERLATVERQQASLVGELERIAGLSATRAREMLIAQIEDEARKQAARRVR
jgi:hypothetical protein